MKPLTTSTGMLPSGLNTPSIGSRARLEVVVVELVGTDHDAQPQRRRVRRRRVGDGNADRVRVNAARCENGQRDQDRVPGALRHHDFGLGTGR